MKAKPISINQVDNGFQVSVGCKNLVFTSREQLIAELSAYLANPEQVEKQYAEKYGWEPLPGVAEQCNTMRPTQESYPDTPVGLRTKEHQH